MSQMLEIHAPAEQEGTRSRLLRWLKKPGEAVAENEPLIELETDKVTVEVAAPGSGVLTEILKQESEELEPGELLGRIAVGVSEAARPSGDSRGAADEAPSLNSGVRRNGAAGHAASGANSPLSPAVRRLLAEHKLDPAAVQGSGQGGRITVEDVLRHAASGAGAGSSKLGAAHSNIATNAAAADSPPGRFVPHSPIRLRVAEHMVQSLLHTAPHVTSIFEADLGALIAHRARHREDFERRGVPITFTAYFLAAAVQAIRAVPEANSRWTDSALEIFEQMDIGVATALEQGGLVVPVLRKVESRDLFEIARGLNDLVSRARENKLTPADMRGGTFTISNHGVSGSLVATPIVIHQPQSAILGVGKLEKRAVVVEENGVERIVVRPRCYVTLTIDHRVMDGLQANRFLQTFVTALEALPAT